MMHLFQLGFGTLVCTWHGRLKSKAVKCFVEDRV